MIIAPSERAPQQKAQQAPLQRSFDISAGGHRLAACWIDPTPDNADRKRPVLVFLHEGLGSIGQWRDFPFVLSTSTGLPALVYDRLGYGNSDPLATPRTVRYLHEEALISLPEVLKKAHADEVIFVGHSDGGSMALIFAASYPEKVRGAITEAAHVFVEEVTLAGIREAAQVYETTSLKERLAAYHGDKTDTMFRTWADIWLSEEFRTWNIEEYLPAITCPLLVMQGQEDEYGTPAQVQAIAGQVSGPVESLLLPGCGHIPHHQARGRVLAEMARFLASLPI